MEHQRAWRLEELGTAPVQREIPIPVPGRGEALVKVAAVGLNFADLLMMAGKYQHRPTLPCTLGLELSGVVDSLGPQPEDAEPMLAPGTRVAAHVKSGAFAEYAVVPVDHLLALPEAMPLPLAAGFQIAYGTAHLALARKAKLKPGETVFITGAAGGVGLTAVEIAKTLGARVIASARGADKAAFLEEAGADVVIDSEAPDLKQRLRDLGGIDVTYDTVGGPAFDAAMRATHPGGRMLAIGFAGGEVPQVALNQLLVRNITVIGLWWGGYLDFAPEELTDSLRDLLQWWQEGRLKPHVSAEMGLDRLPEALALIRERKVTGKLVLTLP